MVSQLFDLLGGDGLGLDALEEDLGVTLRTDSLKRPRNIASLEDNGEARNWCLVLYWSLT